MGNGMDMRCEQSKTHAMCTQYVQGRIERRTKGIFSLWCMAICW